MTVISTQLYQRPVGIPELGVYNDKSCLCNWLNKKNKQAVHNRLSRLLNAKFQQAIHPVSDEAKKTTGQLFPGSVNRVSASTGIGRYLISATRLANTANNPLWSDHQLFAVGRTNKG